MEAAYAQSITINQSFWAEGDTDTRFEVGDQTLWSDLYGSLPANRKRQFNFNNIRRVINMISGKQRQNRKSIVVVPVENGDQETADQFTKVIMWICNQEGVLETISDSFHGSLVTGMNLLQVYLDFQDDPVSGNIKVDNWAYNSFLIDPFFRKTDLSDCNFLWTRRFVTKRESVALMPDKTEEIMELFTRGNGTGRDGKFQFEPESFNYGMTNLLTYDEFYYRDYRTKKMVVDTETGETQEWKGDDKQLELYLNAFPTLDVVESEIPTVRLSLVLEGRVMYDGPHPAGLDTYGFIPVFAYYNPQLPYFPWRIQGVVRGLRDAQFLYNRRKIIELDIYESQLNSGYIYKENALVNPSDIFFTGQGKGIALKSDAQIGDVVQIQPPALPATTFEASRILKQEIMDVSGVNEELLGAAQDDKAGILSMLRQGAGLTTLQILFDQLDRSQKLLGKAMIDIIQQNFAPGKIKKILEGEEPKPQFYNKAFGKYNAVVEEGLNTSTQKQMYLAQLMEWRAAGMQIPDDIIVDAATIQTKKKLIDGINQLKQEQTQMAQAQMQMQAQEAEARIEASKALSVANRGLGLERASRIQENQALAEERKSQAHKEENESLLAYAKAIKELEAIDFSQLEKIIALQKMLKEMEQPSVVTTQPPNQAQGV